MHAFVSSRCPWITKSHLKIIILGIFAIFAVNAIYSAFSHIQKLNVFQSSHFMDFLGIKSNLWYGEPINGLECKAQSEWNNNGNQKKCDKLTKYLYYNTTDTAYHCDSIFYVDLSDRSLFDISDTLYHIFISLSIFSALYGFYAIVHDIGGIYYKNNLRKIKYFPNEYLSNSCMLQLYCAQFAHDSDNISCNRIITLFCIACCFGLPLFLIDFLTISIKYPTYVSAFIVGICRSAMAICAAWYMFEISIGPIIEVDQVINSDCTCSCHFYLPQVNLLSCLVVTITLILSNISFIKSWYLEAKYKKPAFYLVSFRLPFEIARSFRSTNMAFGYDYEHPPDFGAFNNLKIDPRVNDSTYVRMEIDSKSDRDEDEVDEHVSCDITFRKWLYVVLFICSWMYTGFSIILFPIINYYNYGDTVRIAIIVFGIFGLYVGWKYQTAKIDRM